MRDGPGRDMGASVSRPHLGISITKSVPTCGPKEACLIERIERSLYPHAELPLIPLSLLPLLERKNVLLPGARSRPVSDFAQIKPAELSGPELLMACGQIADLVQAALYSRKCAVKMEQIAVCVPDSIRLSELMLSSRAHVALQSRDFFSRSGPWRNCTLRSLVATQALGAKLLLAFLLAVEHGGLIRGGAVQAQAQARCLEDDLQALVGDVLYAARSADVFVFSNGWDGGGERALIDASARHSISKERARQILHTSGAAMRHHLRELEPPHRLRKALDVLETRSPMSAEQAQTALQQAGLTRGTFHPHGILSAARLFGLQTSLSISKLGRLSLVCTPAQSAHLRALQLLSRSMARSLGVISDQWVRTRALQTSPAIALNHVRLALQADAQMHSLAVDSAASQWFWPGPSVKPHGSVVRPLKLIAFFGGATLQRMAADLNSDVAVTDLKIMGTIGEQVLAALLEHWGMAPDEKSVWGPSSPKGLDACRVALAPVEEKMAQIVLRAGGELDKAAFHSLASKERINANTVQSYLRRSPLFLRTERLNDGIFLSGEVCSSHQAEKLR